MRLIGHLDRADPSVVAGWVIDLDEPQRRLALGVHVGGETLGGVVAERFRQDLLVAGLGDGCCFFAFETPRLLSAQDIAALTVRVEGYPFLFTATSTHPVRRDLPRPEGAGGRWRCVLHIGTEKTGTTTLQGFLGKNRDELAARGYFVPSCLCSGLDPVVMNSDLLAAYARADHAPEQATGGGWRGVDPAGFRARIRAALAAELARAPEACHTMLLSAEHCHSRLGAGFEVEGVWSLLAPFCSDFRVLVYLRPQHELALSWYGMMVRQGLADRAPLPHFEGRVAARGEVPFGYFDYAGLLARWGAVFGRAALVPRRFILDALVEGDVVSDVLAVLGIEDIAFVRPERLNTNVSAPAQRVLTGLNRALAEWPAAEAAELRGWVVPRLEAGRGIRPAREAIRAFMAQFEASNEAVRAAWFHERARLFDDGYAEYPEEEAAGDEAEIYAVIARVLQGRIRPGG